MVRTLVSAGRLSLSCARLIVGCVTTLWVKHPLTSHPTRPTQPPIPPGSVVANHAWVVNANGRTHGEQCGLLLNVIECYRLRNRDEHPPSILCDVRQPTLMWDSLPAMGPFGLHCVVSRRWNGKRNPFWDRRCHLWKAEVKVGRTIHSAVRKVCCWNCCLFYVSTLFCQLTAKASKSLVSTNTSVNIS